MDGFSASKSTTQMPCTSSSSESWDSSKSGSTLVTGGSSRASSLFCFSSICIAFVLVISAVVEISFGTIVAVGRGDDVTFGS